MKRTIAPGVPVVALLAQLTQLTACSGDNPVDSDGSAGLSDGLTLTITATASDSDGDSSGSGSGSDSDGGQEKLDLGDDSTLPGGGDCSDVLPKPGDEDYSIIWISNTGQHTVSKIDTASATELARYRTGPGETDPSRTSVNLRGDVAIANRSGSVVKIANQIGDCVDKNVNGVIDTSTGPDDLRDWGSDECVLWFHDLAFPKGLPSNQGGPRAIAWDGGAASNCFATAMVWVGWRDQPSNNVMIRRINGVSGETDSEVLAENWEGNWGHGTYGGAATKGGSFWGLGTRANLVHVDALSLEVSRYKGPDVVLYGITLDADGEPWLAGYDNGHIWRFHSDTAEFQDLGKAGSSARLRGLAIDKQGFAWIAGNDPCALIQYDTTTESIVNGEIALPGCAEPVGVSIDRYGQVWVVDRDANRAYKVDPETYEIVMVDGLVSPYTYSDMTGEGLGLVVNPPVG
ncbi:MAG TPA: hypothetical protein ENJ18_01285 [Nannocystis exedens]|nr:hypothetical protein [Nannocystis exedens]